MPRSRNSFWPPILRPSGPRSCGPLAPGAAALWPPALRPSGPYQFPREFRRTLYCNSSYPLSAIPILKSDIRSIRIVTANWNSAPLAVTPRRGTTRAPEARARNRTARHRNPRPVGRAGEGSRPTRVSGSGSSHCDSSPFPTGLALRPSHVSDRSLPHRIASPSRYRPPFASRV